jgi:general secretion pathway protein B
MLKPIDIQELQPGMVIVKITKQNGPLKIKKSGLVTSHDMVQGLIEMGIQQVEVDPDQTVEVEAPKIKKSATQKMLENNKVTTNRIEDGMSDQYHRSLFLPSVQDIPSAWQFYAKRYSLAGFIALGGLGFGWTLANYQGVLTLLSSPSIKPAVNVPVPLTAPLPSSTKTQESNIQSSANVEELQTTNTIAANEVPKQAISEIEELKPTNQPSLQADDVDQLVTLPSEPEPQISSDLLARFKKAIDEVEDSPKFSSPAKSESGNKDVPRIDQLPAWVMTRLPSMAFSAHMYASVESERWVRVNGTRMVEGDKIDGLIEIVRIEPQHVILNYSGQTFSMAALTDW